jgi:CRISPR-associated protein Csm4
MLISIWGILIEMKTYRLTIEPQSSFVTPLQSDTIFGHLAWAVLYSEGADVLRILLENFQASPPFILSDGFPDDMLPIPVIAPLKKDDKVKLSDVADTDAELKEIKNLKYIPIAAFNNLVGDLSNIKLARYLIKANEVLDEQMSRQKRDLTLMRTAVNRITGSALERQLFDVTEGFYCNGSKVNIWIKFFDYSFIGKVEKWFHSVETFGYGANVSTGSGQFKIESFKEINTLLPNVESPNAFVTLSNFTPAADDPTEGWYQYIVKRGKLGGRWSTVSIDGVSGANVWKKPLIMFRQGSVFRLPVSSVGIKNYYGRMVDKIYQNNTDIVQYALAFPLGVKLRE